MNKVVMPGIMFCLSASLCFAEPATPLSLARLFTDRAVLQRDRPAPVWGACAPGVGVTVSLGDLRSSTVSGADGSWRVYLPAMPAESAGRDLIVKTADGQERILSDIVVGDVWFCSGQSNMELGMAAISNRASEMKDLNAPGLRLYLIPKSASGTKRNEVFGAWMPSDRVSVTTGGWNGFSAVAYTFGRKLTRDLNVPVGLIQAAYGGSPIDAWIPPQDLLSNSLWSGYAAEIRRADDAYAKARATNPDARHPFDDPPDTRDLGPGSIWRAMLEPLGPLAVKGVLWYQGETDVGDGPSYTSKLNAMIAAWRRTFGVADLPFYVVQLAPWDGYGGDSLPRMWLAQEAVLATPGTGLVVTVDVGDPGDIHPANKRPVGERLALQALAKTYGRAGVNADGPVQTGWQLVPGGVLISWKASGKLKTSDGQPPRAFEVLDEGTWRPASARIVETGIVLEAGTGIRGVRYAWSSVPPVNLTDAGDLPARPFMNVR